MVITFAKERTIKKKSSEELLVFSHTNRPQSEILISFAHALPQNVRLEQVMGNRGDDRLAPNPFEQITWQKIQNCYRKFAVTASIKTDVCFAWLLPAFFSPSFFFLFFSA